MYINYVINTLPYITVRHTNPDRCLQDRRGAVPTSAPGAAVPGISGKSVGVS